MTSPDTTHRELCHTLFDAVEAGDLDTVASCYAPDMAFWCNLTGTEQSREQNLETLRDGAAILRRRTYDDRMISTFDDGFVAQYTVTAIAHDGSRRSLWACLVATVHDGRIVRMDEYLDSSKFARPART
jgi:ketosteroid isomerase-like protein